MNNGFIIVNSIDYTYLTITKNWEGDTENDRPEPIKLMQELQLFANSNPYNVGTFEEDGVENGTWKFHSTHYPEITATLEKSGPSVWSVTIHKLPRVVNGADAVWTVKEKMPKYFTTVQVWRSNTARRKSLST